jgi:geranylgeranyl diphosphate synthase type II
MYSAENLLILVNEALEKENFHREPIELYEPIAYILGLGGKRIRPVMLLMAADMYDGRMDQAMPAALGLEIFHNFSLVHDDIMDRAPLRRGKQTVHEKWDANRAILSGDTMLVKAYDQFLKLPEHFIKPALEVFNLTATGVCEGQQMDMNFEERQDVSIQEYIEMIGLKTAVLIGAAFRIGSLVAGAPLADQKQLYEFGLHTGLLFQLRDDLLDTYGDQDVFGKKLYGDIIASKKTCLYLKALEFSGEKDRDDLAKLYSNPATEPAVKVKEVLRFFESAGVKEHTEAMINEHFNLAMTAFDALNVSEEKKKIIRQYTGKLMGRSH